ncbi:Crp/Fnr family transcriptional regulator [Sedimentibacter hydroxybenzoicus DSM 7310]|uniref:Crp/Fnr family transcriptional regulator n=1 Tax=Sedimentibacter hydroxybenzoicus DSM 7310 TaxID=1123245 RepID=A0A974BKS8_SEDHY|nr:Crp/Fnr family transcriptional regulator [Sedimentibacter hydroxybenzoicus]NYB74480.1 Crp/Fnr family transcriptional regulator [Sedimentibacter hydroxybenzoicus DSM 7310]
MLNNSLFIIEDESIQNKVMEYSKNIRYYRKGSLIYQQEDKRDFLYFLTEGSVRVSISNSNGSEKTLAINEPASFFGETAFFDEFPSFSRAEALKDSTVVLLNKEQITNMIKDYPDLAFYIFNSMSRKIRLLSFQVEYLSFMKIEERLVSLLLTLFFTFGVKCSNDNISKEKPCKLKDACPNGQFLNLTITDQEIGDMISARREAITKALNNLKSQKLIYKNKRTICCPDLSILEDILSNLD